MNMKKNWKRWTSLFMAVTMVMASGAISTNQALRANEAETGVTEGTGETTETVDVQSDAAATLEATAEATAEPTTEPVEVVVDENTDAKPTEEAAATAEVTAEATAEATVEATVEPTAEATAKGTAEPTAEATATAKPITYPAYSTSVQTASGMTVTIAAPEGAFPEGTYVTVTEVNAADYQAAVESETGKSVKGAKAVDITFRDKAGNEIEPLTAISVTFSNPAVSGDSLSVFHAENTNSVSQVGQSGNTNEVTIEASDFSVYVVTGTGEDATEAPSAEATPTATAASYTLTTIVGDTTTTTTVTGGTQEVADPVVEGKVFLNWSGSDGNTYTPVNNITTITMTNDLTLTAQFREYYQLSVYYAYSNGSIAHTTFSAQYMPGTHATVPVPSIEGYTATKDSQEITGDSITVTMDSDKEINIIYDPETIAYTVTRYYQELDGSYTSVKDENTYEGLIGESTAADAGTFNEEQYTAQPIEQKVLTTASTNVDVYYNLKQHHVYFDSQGGSYCTTVNALYGTEIDVSDKIPTRQGYQFDGWTYNAEGTGDLVTTVTLVSTAEKSNPDTTLYAKWTALSVSYRILYWQESTTTGKYDYIEAGSGTAIAGTSVSADLVRDTTKTYKYFHYDSAASDTSVTIAADGTSIVNVRYARNTYKFVFKINKNNAKLTIGGQTYTNNGNKYSFTAKYGEDISSRWPTATNFDTNYSSQFEGWSGGSASGLHSSMRWNVTPELIKTDSDNAEQVFTGNWDDDLETVYLHYYVQNANDNGYSELTAYTQTANTSGGFSAKDIEGYTKVSGTPDGYPATGDKNCHYVYNSRRGDWDWVCEYHYYFYYNRQTYSITFDNVKSPSTVDNIRYGADISGKSIDTADQQPAGSENYVFAGWYTTPDYLEGTEFDFTNATMPSHNLVLYAKWTPYNVTVSFDTQGGSAIASQTLQAGQTVARPADPTREGYKFVNWYTAADSTEEFDFNQPIKKDTTIYAKWEEITVTNYKVVYWDAVNQTNLYEPVTIAGKVGKTVYAVAKAVPAGRTLIVDKTQAQLVLTANEADNVITFTYNEPHDIYYLVKYISAVDNTEILSETTVKTRLNQVIVYADLAALKAEGYVPTQSWQVKALDDETDPASLNNNVITFTCQKLVTVTANNKSKAYGTTDPELNATVTGTLGTDTVTYTVSRVAGEDAGTYAITPAGNAAQGNYAVSYINGTFTITQQSIDPNDPSYHDVNVGNVGDVKYNGNNQEQIPAVTDKNGTSLVKDTDYTVSFSDDTKNTGIVTVTITGTGNYTGNVSRTYNITPRSITIDSASGTKIYDQAALTNDTITTSGDGWANEEGATYTVTGSQTLAGVSKNTFSYVLNENTLAKNYTITKNEGTLTVTAVVTVNYLYADGSVAYPTVKVTLNEANGYLYNIPSPVISGFTASNKFVASTEPTRVNLTINIIYTAVVVPTPTPTSTPAEPTPTPTPGRTCQDDGYPAGYYWSEAAQACVIDIVPETPVNPGDGPVVTPPANPEGGAEITVNDNGTVQVTPIQDVQTPLSKLESEHKCNALPFLFSLLILLVVILFTKDAKKRQKKIHELKEELELRKAGVDPSTISTDTPATETNADPSKETKLA